MRNKIVTGITLISITAAMLLAGCRGTKDTATSEKAESAVSAASTEAASESAEAAEPETADVSEDLVGEYTATYDMTEMLSENLKDTGITLSQKIVAAFKLNLAEDGTFTFDLDGDTFSKDVQAILETDGEKIVTALLEEEGITEDTYEEVARNSGFKSFDEFKDNTVQNMISGVADTIAESTDATTHFSGQFKENGSELELTTDTMELENAMVNEDGSIDFVLDVDETPIGLHFEK